MAYSGAVSGTTFNALKVVDHAFRRCRLPAQSITSEMHSYALDSLYVFLSELANIKTPSWCIEKMVLPMYQNQPVVVLPPGTVEVLNLNYRTLQIVTGVNTTAGNLYQVNFTTTTVVDTVGVKWSGPSVPLYFQVSTNGSTWTTVGSYDDTNVAGEISWNDISGAIPYQYFRIYTQNPNDVFNYTAIELGNLPQEIPLGQLNRDSYVNQSNKVVPGRPSNYYFQRDLPEPVVYLWPAPFSAAEQAQLVLWRHRQIMDTQNLRQEVEVPQRWLEAIIDGLAARVAAETPQVDLQVMAVREQKAAISLQRAWDGDNDGSPIQINPGIRAYTA
jgi:hypothetical protein